MVLVCRYDDPLLGQPMALCVVIEEQVDETVVITAYGVPSSRSS
jgi:hypothetical protein